MSWQHPPSRDIFCSVILSFLLRFARLFQHRRPVPRGAFSQCHLVSAAAAPDGCFEASGLIYNRMIFESQQAAQTGY